MKSNDTIFVVMEIISAQIQIVEARTSVKQKLSPGCHQSEPEDQISTTDYI